MCVHVCACTRVCPHTCQTFCLPPLSDRVCPGSGCFQGDPPPADAVSPLGGGKALLLAVETQGLSCRGTCPQASAGSTSSSGVLRMVPSKWEVGAGPGRWPIFCRGITTCGMTSKS